MFCYLLKTTCAFIYTCRVIPARQTTRPMKLVKFILSPPKVNAILNVQISYNNYITNISFKCDQRAYKTIQKPTLKIPEIDSVKLDVCNTTKYSERLSRNPRTEPIKIRKRVHKASPKLAARKTCEESAKLGPVNGRKVKFILSYLINLGEFLTRNHSF